MITVVVVVVVVPTYFSELTCQVGNDFLLARHNFWLAKNTSTFLTKLKE